MITVLGFLLVVMPAVFQMFTKAPKGATMLRQFQPFMTNARLDGYQQEIATINAAVHETDTAVAQRLATAGVEKPGSGTEAADYAGFAAQWPAIDADMTSLMDKVQGNLGNYRAVGALPSFDLFPWFFVVPGVLLLGLGLLGRFVPARRLPALIGAGAIGAGLVAAPFAFQMFSRAPEGGHMMTAFRSIETTQNVEQIQGYFSTMAIGQGAIRLQIVPALEATGLSPGQIAAAYPQVAALDAEWVHILNDMTPMIGAMADNVSGYQAVASLPPFPLFPYFFVLPGLIALGLAAVGVRQGRRVSDLAVVTEPARVPEGVS